MSIKINKLFTLCIFLTSFNIFSVDNIKFACTQGDKITITAVGDILLHKYLQKVAAQKEDFSYLWNHFEHYFQNADIAYANLEGTTAFNSPQTGKKLENPSPIWNKEAFNKEYKKPYKKPGNKYYSKTSGTYYSEYPWFNYHPDLIDSLKNSGFDIVSTANNHSMDRWAKGVDKTIDELESENILYAGTRKIEDSDIENYNWSTITTTPEGIEIAWIACADHLNGNRDDYGQTLRCYTPYGLKQIKSLIKEHTDENRFVILTPHWGDEYQPNFNKKQKTYAQLWLDQGAGLILGSHPHVYQPVKKYTTKDGRETLIVYSMGNFVSGQEALKKQTTGVINIGLTQTLTGEIVLNGVKLIPAYMQNNVSAGIPQEKEWEFEHPLLKGSYFNETAMTLLPILESDKTYHHLWMKGVIGEENITYYGDEIVTDSNCYEKTQENIIE